MLTGYAPGVWDLLHVGHVRFLLEASRQCDYLIVGVPSDRVVEEDKGVPPIITLTHRCYMLQNLGCVKQAIPYHRLEFLTHLNNYRPDILFVGEQWGSDQRHKDAEQWISDNQKTLIRISYYQGESSTKIKERIRRDSH